MRRRAAPWLVAGGTIASIAVGGVLAWRAQGRPRPEPEQPLAAGFAGTAACARCHPDQARDHGASGHAATLWRVDAKGAPAVPPSAWKRDPDLPVTFRITRRGGAPGVEVTAGDVRRWQPAHWIFGSGRHGITLVGAAGAGRYVELPLSHYPGRGWDLTPGYLAHAPARRIFHPAGMPADHTRFFPCFDCHATATGKAEADLDLSRMRPGVQCERCHGPGGRHARAAVAGEPLRGTIRNPGQASAREQVRMCGECHRSEPPPGFKPEAPELVRYAPVGLLRSACFRASGERLACSSCHNPHHDAPGLVERSEATCRSCHQASTPKQKPCPVNPSAGCVGCHMPRVEAARHSFFTDHWIRVRKAATPAPGVPPPAATDAPGGH